MVEEDYALYSPQRADQVLRHKELEDMILLETMSSACIE